MAEFIVHSIPGSPFGRAVLATLLEKGADLRFAAVTAERPNLQAWLRRMNDRSSFQGTTWERVVQMAKAA